MQAAPQRVAAGFRAAEPPADIAADWRALGDGVERIASTDVDAPGGRAAFQERLGQLQAQVGPASAEVGAYLRNECGLDAAAGPAGPRG